MPPDRLTLAFDTSAAHCAAALLCGEAVLAETHEDMARGQAERLFALLDEVLAAAGAGWPELDRLAVGVGPGNFTGIRVSVSAARGLALGLGIPALGVSVLEAQARGQPRPVAAAVAARGTSFFLQRFGPEGEDPARLVDAAALSPGALAGTPLVGRRLDPLAEATGARVLAPAEPLAVAIARIGAAAGPDAAARPPRPLYLRPADAAPARDGAPTLLP